jgi:hypothetical protein
MDVTSTGLGGIMLALDWSRQTMLLVSAVPELIAAAAIVALMRLERQKITLHRDVKVLQGLPSRTQSSLEHSSVHS